MSREASRSIKKGEEASEKAKKTLGILRKPREASVRVKKSPEDKKLSVCLRKCQKTPGHVIKHHV